MIVSFNFLFNNVKFDMWIDYLADHFDFQSKVISENNIATIADRYKSIDQVEIVHVTGRDVLRVKYLDRYKHAILPDPILVCDPDWKMYSPQEVKWIELKLNATIYLHKGRSHVNWYTTGKVPFWFNRILEVHYAAIEQVLMGTAIHNLPELKKAAKAVVAENASRRARIMLANADTILEFLNDDG